MTEKDVLSYIGINKLGHETNKGYEVELSDSKEWGKIFSTLENSAILDPLEEESTIESFVYGYHNELSDQWFLVSLNSPLEEEKYTLVVTAEEED